MSKQKEGWFSQNAEVGYIAERGKPWWATDRDVENLHDGAIPPERVKALFQKARAELRATNFIDENGYSVEIPDRMAVVIPGMGNHVSYITGGKESFAIHQYEQELYERSLTLINGVGFASAGLLDGGSRAWVQLERPQNLDAAGYKFRVGLLVATALDGSMKTTWRDTETGVVCDNTLSAALFGVSTHEIKVKHTRNSLEALADGGAATMAINEIATKLGYAIEAASKRVVTNQQFEAFLQALVPLPDQDKSDQKRGFTIAMNKRADISRLYHSDERAAPWAGSALGVVQAVNTYNNHIATVRNAERAERNMDNVISGKLDFMDQLAWETLNKVLVAV